MKGAEEVYVGIEETPCWSCARLKREEGGYYSCPNNRRLPKTLPREFALKCILYRERVRIDVL